ncbi:MAG: VOC family protein [Alicyclobacillus sp.]|nr:VOC family protein [Alicyclobacillus sp.]
MRVKRIDHVSINVQDLAAAKAFFLDLGLEVHGEWEMEGAWLGRLIGLSDAKTACVGLRTPDGQTWIELVKFHYPSSEQGHQIALANTPGIRHIAFAVEDIENMVAKLKNRGTEVFSEIQTYEDRYKLCYVRGPEGVIIELAEEI